MSADSSVHSSLYEKTCRWLDQNKEFFGDKILCTGIDAATAGHLARMFPRAMIVCLTGSSRDEDPDGLQLSGRPDKLREPLWIPAAPDEYEGGLFDTLVSFAETPLCPAVPPNDFPTWERGTLYLRRVSLLMDYYEKKARALRRHLRDGGSLLTLVRSDHDEYLLGFCLALAAEGMEVDPSSLRQILCREGDSRVVLQAVTARAGGRSDVTALVAENINYSLDRMNTAAEELRGRDAEVFLQAECAELIRGYHIYQGETLMGKLALYSSVQRPNVIYYYTDVAGDEPWLRRFHVQDRDKLLRHMVGELHRQKATNGEIEWYELQLTEDWQEIEL